MKRSTSFMLYLFGLLTVRLISIVILGWWIYMFNAVRRPMKENPNSYEVELNLGSDTPLLWEASWRQEASWLRLSIFLISETVWDVAFSSSHLSHYVTFNFLYHYLLWISVINPINSDNKFPNFSLLKKSVFTTNNHHTIASWTRISLNSWNGYFPPPTIRCEKVGLLIFPIIFHLKIVVTDYLHPKYLVSYMQQRTYLDSRILQKKFVFAVV